MKNKIISITICAFIAICSIFISYFTPQNVAYANTESMFCSAKSMCLIEGNSGRIILEKNKDMKLAMASVTKIITAITAIENSSDDLDKKYVVPDKAIGIEGTSMYLKKGEELTKRELLYGLMLPSGNDAATALALLTCDTEEEFCGLMKQTCEKVGAINSNFVNAHGLDADGHYTTAYDLALVTAYALNNPVFLEVSKTKNIMIEATNQYDVRYLRNKNKLLLNNENCIGVKTGFTDNAGRCFVSATDQNNMKMVCVVLNCGPMFEESASCLEFANTKYSMQNILTANKYITSLPVQYGDKNFARIYNESSFCYPLSESELENLSIERILPEKIDAPLDIGDVVGQINIFIDKDLIFSSNLCSIDKVEKIDKFDKFEDILDKWI